MIGYEEDDTSAGCSGLGGAAFVARTSWQVIEFYELKASGGGRVNRVCNRRGATPEKVPVVRGHDDESDLAALQILLVEDALVGGHHHLEAFLFGFREQVAILECVPAHILGGFDVMPS